MSNNNWVGIWADTETTGINPFLGEKLLEVACFITDPDGNFFDEEGYHAVIRYTPEEVEELKKKTDPYVVNMHTVSGLWDLLPEGKPLELVEQELLAYIQKFVKEPKFGRLAGNSVRLDFNFIDKFLPKVSEYLHYRVIDVSTLRAVADEWLDGFEHDKPTPHEAKADILLSIGEYLAIKKAMGF